MTAMPSTERNLIFGYGSLVARADRAEDSAVACHLEDFRRGWNVAMDSTVTIPSYKYYVDEGTGERPEVYVSFLNIWLAAGSRVNGVAYEVDEEILALLDLRERNYDRHEVTAQIELEAPGRVWAYVGQAQARERYEAGRAKRNAVVCEEYYRAVRGKFALRARHARRVRPHDRRPRGPAASAHAHRPAREGSGTHQGAGRRWSAQGAV